MTSNPDQNRVGLAFADLAAPILLDGAVSLLPMIRRVLVDWLPDSVDADAAAPCLTITEPRPGRYVLTTPDSPPPERDWDAVNAVCDLVVELAWEQVRSNPSWLCLHCAAVEFAGRLVLFPNRRRAGKSTLSAVLAARGYRVFTDDFLPVQVDGSGHITGRANGILPRLRLPLPKGFSQGFVDWVAANPGPLNRKYKYLETQALAPRGASLPIGAVVILDRDGDGETGLSEVSQSVALDDMITQNFARSLHAARILVASQRVTETAELYRMRYQSAEQAADLLEARFSEWRAPVRVSETRGEMPTGGADLAMLEQAAPKLDTTQDQMRAPGVTEVTVGDVVYLTDAHGLGVHRLNPGSHALWQLLAEPGSLTEMTDLLCAAFPEVPRAQIEQDNLATLRQFAKARLIVPVRTDEQISA